MARMGNVFLKMRMNRDSSSQCCKFRDSFKEGPMFEARILRCWRQGGSKKSRHGLKKASRSMVADCGVQDWKAKVDRKRKRADLGLRRFTTNEWINWKRQKSAGRKMTFQGRNEGRMNRGKEHSIVTASFQDKSAKLALRSAVERPKLVQTNFS
jgi:hypothetical protein